MFGSKKIVHYICESISGSKKSDTCFNLKQNKISAPKSLKWEENSKIVEPKYIFFQTKFHESEITESVLHAAPLGGATLNFKKIVFGFLPLKLRVV